MTTTERTVLDSQAMRAHLVDSSGKRLAFVSVPLLFDGVLPQVPSAIQVGRNVAILESTIPLTYVDHGAPYLSAVIERYEE